MPELYLRLLDRVLTPVLLVLAVFLFMRGHNLPGGGFVAGLAAAAAFQLQILARGDDYVMTMCAGALAAISSRSPAWVCCWPRWRRS
jgi:multisubunit Na+/H+ antiporter MnhB subunit